MAKEATAKSTISSINVGFRNVVLFKDQILGIGSYGKVCKAKCDDLPCAAKLMHETLFDPSAVAEITPQREHRLPIKRFEQECAVLSTIRHPNIVQYLGMYEDPVTGTPALLMELMDDSLTHFLESTLQRIPYHVQVNICHDITLALSFLHSNSIIHRDLSSNNVLMVGSSKAKVTDFGMARLGDLNPHSSHFTHTMCPGTDVYMPPEAIDDHPVYTEKIDCFSFGVIIVQILTQKFPAPGDRYEIIEINLPQIRGRKVKVSIPEVDRRQNHIKEIDPVNPLLIISLDCLRDKDVERPSAQQLCERIACLTETPKYADSKMDTNATDIACQEMQHVPQNLRLHDHLSELQLSHDESGEQVTHKEQTQLRNETVQMEAIEHPTCYDPKQQDLIDEPHQQQLLHRVNIQREEQVIANQGVVACTTMKDPNPFHLSLSWREGENAPCTMYSDFSAAVDSTTVYIRPGGHAVYAFKISTSTWCQLQKCPNTECPSVIINGYLTFIGGMNDGTITNQLFSWAKEGSQQMWTKKFPPMPTKRWGAAALCTKTNSIVVAGGEGEGETVLRTIEVMNTDTLQWYSAVDLPQALCYATLTTCGDCVYLQGGNDNDQEPNRQVYKCSSANFNPPPRMGSFRAHFRDILHPFTETSTLKNVGAWTRITDLPVSYSSFVTFQEKLLSIGGMDLNDKPSTAIYMYNPGDNSWEVISHLLIPRYDCIAAVISNTQLVVVGGRTNNGKTSSVEIATTL